MHQSIPVYLGPPPQAPWQTISHDWFGRPARHLARFRLSLESAGLLTYEFSAQKRPECDLSTSPGDFVEGLWEHDVAELFLMGPEGDYHELNLSPCGAWWSASFANYRQRLCALKCPSATTRANWDETQWTASLSLNLRDLTLGKMSEPRSLRISVTAILAPSDPEYLCFGHQSGGDPDFHLASTFLPLGAFSHPGTKV